MKLAILSGSPEKQKVDVLVLGVFEMPEAKGKKKKAPPTPELAALDAALDGVLMTAARDDHFEGASGQTFALHTHGRLGARRVVLVGLGAPDKASLDSYRGLGGRAVAAAGGHAEKLAVFLPTTTSVSGGAAAEAAAEGLLLATYRFDRYLSDDKNKPALKEAVVLHDDVTGDSRHALRRAKAVADGVRLARDLVNECPRALTPAQFADEARKVGTETGIEVTVLTERELKKERMELMLAVSQAATPYTPPRLVRLAYRPKGKARRHFALVGKGLTFDSGGLDIKPAAGMLEMKIDMGGAAAVLGAMRAIGHLKPDVAVTGYLGCVENGIGGNAYHPGDVLKSRKGLTVEVNNTDAEGRLVLADVIDFALTRDKPDILVDLATLTGACMVALGPLTAGLFSDDDLLAEDIRASGLRAGEDFWRLPLNRELGYQLKSNIADTKNTGDRYGGAITAALFLEKFVDDRARWAHLDIAGPCTMERDHPYTPRGGAGFGVRTLVGLVAPR